MKNTFVIVADFINEIVDEKGAFGAHNAQRIKDNKTMQKANKLIAWARDNSVQIAHVKVGFTKEYKECSKVSPMFKKAPEYGVLQLGTWATEFHPQMDVQEHDIIITKHRVSALYGTDLEFILRANSIEHVIICGVSTSYVVESTVRELHDRDFKVTVIADACNAASQQAHEASLTNLSRIADIVDIDDFI
ncbi:cysteine hydrolase [Francisella tularensis subsp. novicida]|uniref:Cysteine hydrolase n=2 Tax=Francisella tularensis TaxID=263 RepID=A0A6I4RV82_FRATU|nr:isochorismatase family cysteine hydrolase [Francisella tularensis]ABK89983.1 isochorismatase family protein [Francisella tularensis subsp. novicida U112]AJI61255.1 isochorismatase family protein [Francisella tularensis subsp. novicida U112]EDX19505.1 isochorismatase family protein [Francisella tularensis subsp. novicida FTE]MBK2035567.1 cysteine hydrolase [Francisella tularensis subsp. novicida]MBK2115535.1 cysteine hydrolase [Francisella tularensis subsp. novicida]